MTFETPLSGRGNPEFREDWQTLHDDANARRETAFAAKQELIRRLPAISEAERESFQVLNAEWEEAHSLCLRCLDVYQHRTFEDALAWINRSFCSDAPVAIENIDEYDDVRQLLHAAHGIYSKPRKIAAIARNTMALAQADTFLPFHDVTSCTTLEILIPRNRYRTTADIHAHYTVHDMQGGMHVALQTGRRSMGPLLACELLIEEFLRSQVPEWTAQSWFRRRRLPDLTFYTYMPPSEFSNEMFDRVKLAAPLTPGQPISVAGWPSVGCVPAAIRPKWLPGGLADWGSFVSDDDE